MTGQNINLTIFIVLTLVFFLNPIVSIKINEEQSLDDTNINNSKDSLIQQQIQLTPSNIYNRRFALISQRYNKYCRIYSDKVVCQSDTITEDEQFQSFVYDNGKIGLLRAKDGMVCQDNTKFRCDATNRQAWESFEIQIVDEAQSIVAIKGGRLSQYCAAEDDYIICDRPHNLQHEWFKIVLIRSIYDISNQKFGLFSLHNNKICSRNNGNSGNYMTCSTDILGEDQLFQGTFVNNNQFAIKSFKEQQQCSDRGSTIECTMDHILADEKFTVDLIDDTTKTIALIGGKSQKYCRNEGSKLLCDSNQPGQNAQFRFLQFNNPVFDIKDQLFAIKSVSLNKFCQAVDSTVKCNLDQINIQAQFKGIIGNNYGQVIQTLYAKNYLSDQGNGFRSDAGMIQAHEYFYLEQIDQANKIFAMRGGNQFKYCKGSLDQFSCRENSITNTEKFQLVPIDIYQDVINIQFALYSKRFNKYCSVLESGLVFCDSNFIGKDQQFQGVQINEDFVQGIRSLKTGRYCSDQDTELNCNSTEITDREKFWIQIVNKENKIVGLQSKFDQKYCAAEVNRVVCDRSQVYGWEEFQIVLINDNVLTVRGVRNSNYDLSKITFALKSVATNKYCTDLNDKITCLSDTVGNLNKFYAYNVDNDYVAIGGIQNQKFFSNQQDTTLRSDAQQVDKSESFIIEPLDSEGVTIAIRSKSNGYYCGIRSSNNQIHCEFAGIITVEKFYIVPISVCATNEVYFDGGCKNCNYIFNCKQCQREINQEFVAITCTSYT